MASVYLAHEASLDRHVALKVLPPEFLHDPDFAERFKREAKAIARLEHPNIVPIYAYDIDRAKGLPWMALRLVGNPDPGKQRGGALSQLLKRGALDAGRAVAILRSVADALDYAHGKGIVHRDVKPPNVLLDEDGRVYLADFGIAKMLESSGGLTATGMITGTPQYMAPEQATGTKVGPAADIYALGIVAYEMLTGRVPFAADTPVAIMMKHVQEPLPLPPPERVSEPLLRAILECTAKKPEERWPSAGAFVGALEAGLEARTLPAGDVPTIVVPPPAPTSSPGERPFRPRRPRCGGRSPSCLPRRLLRHRCVAEGSLRPCSSAWAAPACSSWPGRSAWPFSCSAAGRSRRRHPHRRWPRPRRRFPSDAPSPRRRPPLRRRRPRPPCPRPRWRPGATPPRSRSRRRPRRSRGR